MPNFYVRIKPEFNGTNIVHKEGCPFMPESGNRIPLGEFSSYKIASKEAGKYFLRITGCYFCIKERYESTGANIRRFSPGNPIRVSEDQKN
jgi:hypothetical protein